MPIYFYKAKYTAQVFRARWSLDPRDISELMRPSIERFGGRVIVCLLTVEGAEPAGFIEFPDNISAAARGMHLQSGGSIEEMPITPMMTTEDGLEAMRRVGREAARQAADLVARTLSPCLCLAVIPRTRSIMATTLAQRLENRAAALVAEAKNHPLAQCWSLRRRRTEPTLLAAIRGVLLRVHYYGRSLTRSIFHAIGRIVTSDPDAARWLVELGFGRGPAPRHGFPGLRQDGRRRRPSSKRLDTAPLAYVVAATVDMLARSENPYAFLGALHPSGVLRRGPSSRPFPRP